MPKSKKIELIEAVIEANQQKVQRLVEQGANLNEQDQLGFSALHYAAQNYLIDIAAMLLEKKAQVDLRDNYGNTPLFKAVFNSKGRGEMIQLLLGHGAQKELKNDHGVSPLELSQTIANYKVAQFLE